MPTAEDSLFERLRHVEEKKPTAPTEGSPEEVYAKKGQPAETDLVTLRNLFSHPDAHPVVIDFALLKAFGVDWHRWLPETLKDELKETFSQTVSELCLNKVHALQTMHVSSMPWTKWQVFEKVAQVLNGNLPTFATMQMLYLEDLYGAVDMMEFIQKRQFSDEVKLYMAATVLNEDVFFVPPPLDFIQLEVSQPHQRCKDCGMEEPALFHDGFCSQCVGRLHPLQGLSLAPMQSRVNDGKGKNLETVIRFDPAPAAKKWEQVKTAAIKDFTPDVHQPGDLQVWKLLMARDYLNIRRRQLTEQLTSIKSWLGAA